MYATATVINSGEGGSYYAFDFHDVRFCGYIDGAGALILQSPSRHLPFDYALKAMCFDAINRLPAEAALRDMGAQTTATACVATEHAGESTRTLARGSTAQCLDAIANHVGRHVTVWHAADEHRVVHHTTTGSIALSGVFSAEIDSRTRIVINAGDEDASTTTYGAFIADNADAIADGIIDPTEIRRHLTARETYQGGGGATASWTLALESQPCPICATPIGPEGCGKAYRCLCGDFISCDDYCGRPQCPGYKVSPDQWRAHS